MKINRFSSKEFVGFRNYELLIIKIMLFVLLLANLLDFNQERTIKNCSTLTLIVSRQMILRWARNYN